MTEKLLYAINCREDPLTDITWSNSDEQQENGNAPQYKATIKIISRGINGKLNSLRTRVMETCDERNYKRNGEKESYPSLPIPLAAGFPALFFFWVLLLILCRRAQTATSYKGKKTRKRISTCFGNSHGFLYIVAAVEFELPKNIENTQQIFWSSSVLNILIRKVIVLQRNPGCLYF